MQGLSVMYIFYILVELEDRAIAVFLDHSQKIYFLFKYYQNFFFFFFFEPRK